MYIASLHSVQGHAVIIIALDIATIDRVRTHIHTYVYTSLLCIYMQFRRCLAWEKHPGCIAVPIAAYMTEQVVWLHSLLNYIAMTHCTGTLSGFQSA